MALNHAYGISLRSPQYQKAIIVVISAEKFSWKPLPERKNKSRTKNRLSFSHLNSLFSHI